MIYNFVNVVIIFNFKSALLSIIVVDVIFYGWNLFEGNWSLFMIDLLTTYNFILIVSFTGCYEVTLQTPFLLDRFPKECYWIILNRTWLCGFLQLLQKMFIYVIQ